MLGFLLYFIILSIIFKTYEMFSNKYIPLPDIETNKKMKIYYEKIEGKRNDQNFIGWILIFYICLGFFLVGDTSYDGCTPARFNAC